MTFYVLLINQLLCPAFNLELRKIQTTQHALYIDDENTRQISLIISSVFFSLAILIISYKDLMASKYSKRIYDIEINHRNVNAQNSENILDCHDKLVYAKAGLKINGQVVDELTGIKMQNVAKVKRRVQVREYRREQKLCHNKVITSNMLKWTTKNIQQNGKNPPQNWFIKPETIKANQVYFGKYLLNDKQLVELTCDKTLMISKKLLNSLTRKMCNNTHGSPVIHDNYIYFPKTDSDIQSYGSLRMKIQYCSNETVTVLAKSVGFSFQEYFFPIQQRPCLANSNDVKIIKIEQPDQKGISLIVHGQISLEELVKYKKDWTINQLIIIKILPFLLLYFSIDMMVFSLAPSENKIIFLKKSVVTILLVIWVYLACSSIVRLIFNFDFGFIQALKCGIYSVFVTIFYNKYWAEISQLSDTV